MGNLSISNIFGCVEEYTYSVAIFHRREIQNREKTFSICPRLQNVIYINNSDFRFSMKSKSIVLLALSPAMHIYGTIELL